MAQLGKQLKDYRLTTAKIIYHMPDYRNILQEFIWQD
ncbi:MAG TPA: Usg family protein, partial [Rhodospirillaceae bacterium]|nr:Usg family protein [Rhodospirillaceae bacterium]